MRSSIHPGRPTIWSIGTPRRLVGSISTTTASISRFIPLTRGIADGSGLSRHNRVTTRAISDLLVVMRDHRYGDVFYESLSVGGVDGTIRNRFEDLPGIVHAKTGYVGGVRSLSGYAPSRRGEIVFSFIYNRIPGPVLSYEQLQDDVVRLLMTWPDLDYIPPPATQPTAGQQVLSVSVSRSGYRIDGASVETEGIPAR